MTYLDNVFKFELKVWPYLHVRYKSANPLDVNAKSVEAYLTTSFGIFERNQQTLDRSRTQYDWLMERFAAGIQNSNAKFIREKSGLVLAEIYSITLKISQFNPLHWSGYQKLPKFLAKKEAIINVKNHDERCFGYSVLAALHPDDLNRHAYRPGRYTDADFAEHGLDVIEYPVSPIDLPRIEQRLNISINVIGFYDDDGKARYPIYCSRHVSETEIDLLYWDGHFA